MLDMSDAGAVRVVGLTGPNAAGKGEVASFLRTFGYIYYSLSDVVREEATARGLDHSRENLIRVGNDLRARFGPGVLAERILEKLNDPSRTRPAEDHLQPAAGEGPGPRAADPPRSAARGVPGSPAGADPRTASCSDLPQWRGAVIDSIRSPFEVAALRRAPGFVLVGVDAAVETRFERSRVRGRLGDGTTLAEFARKEALENTSNPAAQQLGETFRLADIVVSNDGSLDELRARVAAALRLV